MARIYEVGNESNCIEGFGLVMAEDFFPIVEFYRSNRSAGGKFGSLDTGYNGEFGFDWYNAEVDGEGKKAQDAFEKLNITGKDYFVPWLVLWPPKSVLSKYPDIDSSFNPVCKAKLTLKINKGADEAESKGSITLKASSPDIKIDGSQSIKISEVKIGRNTEVEIELINELVKDEFIEVYATDTNELIGKLNVLKNNKIKTVKPTLYQVNVAKAASNTITKGALPIDHVGNFNYLQQNSLNQALVYIKKPDVIHQFSINSSLLHEYQSYETPPYIDYTSENQQYVMKALIESWYQIKTGKTIAAEATNDEEMPDLSPLRGVAYKMIKNIQKSFEEHKGKPNRLALTLNENQKYIDKYKEKRAKFPEILPEPGKPKTTIDAKADAFWKEEATKNDLLFFAIPQIEYLKGPVDINTGKFKNNPGWSVNGCKTIFGFNYLLNNNGTLAHEFGHAFGLGHTFSDEKEVVKKKYEKVEEESDVYYKKISDKLKFIYSAFDSENISKYWLNYKRQVYTINTIDIIMSELRVFEKSEGLSSTIYIKNNNTLNKGKSTKDLNIAQTKENFMDYLNSVSNRKTFNINQIKTLLKRYGK